MHMRRNNQRVITVFTPLLVLWFAAATFGQEGDAPPPPPGDQPDAQREDDAPRDPDARRRRPRRPPEQMNPRETLRRLRDLREAVWKELDLTDEQQQTVGKLFDEHLETFRDLVAEDAEQKQDDRQARLAEIREKIQEARDRGDRDEIQRLREKMIELFRNRSGQWMESTGAFLMDVHQELTAEQRPKYDEILRRLELDRVQRRRGNALQQYLQGLRDPELNLNEEQQQKIAKLVEESRNTLRGGDDEGNAGGRRETMRKLREDILAVMTAEQREKYEQIRENYRKRLAERLRNARDPRANREGGGDEPEPPFERQEGDEPEEEKDDPDPRR
jgi:Spy/CpxP family protein refolding chaperone